MSFEDNPADDDPHGECRYEIERLHSCLRALNIEPIGMELDKCKEINAEWQAEMDFGHKLRDGLQELIENHGTAAGNLHHTFAVVEVGRIKRLLASFSCLVNGCNLPAGADGCCDKHRPL